MHLIGRLADDVNAKEVNGGSKVASFILAVDRSADEADFAILRHTGRSRAPRKPGPGRFLARSSRNKPGAQAGPGRSMQGLRIEWEMTGVGNVVAQSDGYFFPQIRHLSEQILEISRLHN